MRSQALSNEQVGSVCTALAHLLHAGIGMADALVLLEQDEQQTSVRQLFGAMARQVDEGMSLAGAVKESGAFPEYVCALLEVGHRVGKTEQTLNALARYYQNRARLEKQLRTALWYPAMLLLVLLVVTAALLVWVLPVFQDVYARLGSDLTGVAGGLLAFGQWLGKALPWILGAAVLLGSAMAVPGLRKKTAAVCRRSLSDKGVLGKVNTARYMQALTMAMGSGSSDREGALLAEKLAGSENKAFQRRCEACLTALDAGKGLSKALKDARILTPADARLLEVGIRSGQGDSVLQTVSSRLLEESEDALAVAAGKIEPCVVAVCCGVIGLILLSVMLPLMQIMTVIG